MRTPSRLSVRPASGDSGMRASMGKSEEEVSVRWNDTRSGCRLPTKRRPDFRYQFAMPEANLILSIATSPDII